MHLHVHVHVYLHVCMRTLNMAQITMICVVITCEYLGAFLYIRKCKHFEVTAYFILHSGIYSLVQYIVYILVYARLSQYIANRLQRMYFVQLNTLIYAVAHIYNDMFQSPTMQLSPATKSAAGQRPHHTPPAATRPCPRTRPGARATCRSQRRRK